MKPRVKMRCMPGDVGVQEKIEMMENKHPEKKRAKSFRKMIKMRERGVLKNRLRRRLANGEW